MKFVLVVCLCLSPALVLGQAAEEGMDLERLVNLYKVAKGVNYDFGKLDFNKFSGKYNFGEADVTALKAARPDLVADLDEVTALVKNQISGAGAVARVAAPVAAPAQTPQQISYAIESITVPSVALPAAPAAPAVVVPTAAPKEVEIIAQPTVQVKALPFNAAPAVPAVPVVKGVPQGAAPAPHAFSLPSFPSQVVAPVARRPSAYVYDSRVVGPAFSTDGIVPTYGPGLTPAHRYSFVQYYI